MVVDGGNDSSNNKNARELSPWKIGFLLFVVFQLTAWMRGVIIDQERERAAVVLGGVERDATEHSIIYQGQEVQGDNCDGFETCSTCTYARFKYFSSGVEARPTCSWCALSNTCYSPSKENKEACIDPTSNASIGVGYEFNCPLGPTPYPDNPPTLLPDWMSEFYQAGILDQVRLIDLSLPGTHDSLSYDLSLTVSEDGIDNLRRLAELLHTLSGGFLHLLPGDLEEFFRMQGKTQQLSLPQQLDNGIRFIDLRIMWEHDKAEWYSIHFMQSKHSAEYYLHQIRDWLDVHPHEVIVLWLSKHGSTTATGKHAYPGVSPAHKHQFWDKFTTIFDGLLLQTNQSSIFETPMAQLIQRNHRVVAFISDYKEFTNSSDVALDAAKIQNVYDDADGVFHGEGLLQTHVDYFKNATVNNRHMNDNRAYSLLGLNTAANGWQIISAAKRQFLHWMKDLDESRHHASSQRLRYVDSQDVSLEQKQLASMPSPLWKLMSSTERQITDFFGTMLEDKEFEIIDLESTLFHSCASHIKIPGVKHWCPLNLLDIAQLASYYNQIAIDEAYNNSYSDDDSKPDAELFAFPNAFYLDGYDFDGTIRVGPQLLDGTPRGNLNSTMKDAKYGVVDTILAYNARLACQSGTSDSSNCQRLSDRINERRFRYPVQKWNEPELGRRDDWPPYSTNVSIRKDHPGMLKQSTVWRR